MFENRKDKLYFVENGKEKLVSEFFPEVTLVESVRDGTSRAASPRFHLKVAYEGTLHSIVVDGLKGIDFFGKLMIPNVERKNEKYLVQKLEQDASMCDKTVVYELDFGFFTIEGVPVYNFGGHILQTGNIPIHSKKTPVVEIDTGLLSGDITRTVMGYADYTESVSIIVFYFLILTLSKPVIKNEYLLDFSLFLDGKRGHGKTAILNLMLFTDSSRKVSFASLDNVNQRKRRLEDNVGLTVLADDLRPIKKREPREKQEERLDLYTRWISFEGENLSSLVISGEYVDGVASCLDRMLIAYVDPIDETEKQRRKQIADNMPALLYPTFSYYFCRYLVYHYDEIIADIREFMSGDTEIVSSSRPMRLNEHIKFFRMAEYVFRKHFCGGDEKLSHRTELEAALLKNAKRQEELLVTKDEEEDTSRDPVVELFNAFENYVHSDLVTDDRGMFVKGKACALVFNDRVWLKEYGIEILIEENSGILADYKDVIDKLKKLHLLDCETNRRKKSLVYEGKKYTFYCIYLKKFTDYACKHGGAPRTGHIIVKKHTSR